MSYMDYDVDDKGNRLFRSSLPAIDQQAMGNPAALLDALLSETKKDRAALQGKGLRYFTEGERHLALTMASDAYRQRLHTLNMTHAPAIRDSLEYSEAVKNVKNLFYSTVINLNYPHIHRFAEKNASLFDTWLEASRDDAIAAKWPVLSPMDKMIHAQKLEDTFWSIADPDGKLFSLSQIDKATTGILVLEKTPDIDHVVYAGVRPVNQQIVMHQNRIDVTNVPDAAIDTKMVMFNKYHTQAYLDHSANGKKTIYQSVLNDLDFTKEILAHELTHKLETMLVLAYEKDPQFVQEHYGFTKEHRNTYTLMERIYQGGNNETAYQYADNLKETLATDIAGRVILAHAGKKSGIKPN